MTILQILQERKDTILDIDFRDEVIDEKKECIVHYKNGGLEAIDIEGITEKERQECIKWIIENNLLRLPF